MLKTMKGSAILPIIVLALVGVGLFLSRPSRSTGVDFGRIPESFQSFHGRDIPVDPVAVEILQPDGMLMRRYDDPQGRPYWLCIVYHQNNKYGAHDVPVCYTSQGYAKKLLDQELLSAGGLTVNRLVAGKMFDTRLVYYWFATGDAYFADAGAFRRAQMISGLVHNRSHGALVRLETQIEGDDVAGAEARLQALTARVLESLPRAFSAGR